MDGNREQRQEHPQSILLVIEQEARESLGKLRLAYSGRPEEEEGGEGSLRVLETGSREPHGIGDAARVADGRRQQGPSMIWRKIS
jgi:hypothetical protein